MKAFEKIKEIANSFKEHRINYAEKQAQEIVCQVLKIDKVKLYTQNPSITQEQLTIINDFVKRRLQREPLQYIFGETDFFNIKLKVGHGVLIPRQETEVLVEEFLKRAAQIKKIGNKIIDLCTGSGCIAISIAKNIPDFEVFGIDISKTAIDYAMKNKILNQVENAHFIVGNLFAPFKEKIFAAITANPPYIKTDEINKLQPEVKNYEPQQALDGGIDGLKYYREILREAKKYLLKDGFIFFEMGIDQAGFIKAMAEKGFEVIETVKDLAGIERVMILKNK